MIHDKSFLKSFGCAFEGLRHALRYNRNLRVDFFAGLIVIFLSVYFQVNTFEMGILGVMILLVILSEMINTSLEEIVNLITNEHKKEAKIAKDVAAGMVLVAAMGSVIVGIFIFAPYISKLLY